MARRREYTLYAPYRGGPLTNKTLQGARPPYVTYTVYAASIRQAYYLAGNEVMADDAQTVGVREIEWDWWHRRSDPEPNDWIKADYLHDPVSP